MLLNNITNSKNEKLDFNKFDWSIYRTAGVNKYNIKVKSLIRNRVFSKYRCSKNNINGNRVFNIYT